MTPSKPTPKRQYPKPAGQAPRKELIIVTGISGAGKASALRAFEDLGYHAVDNLPLELLPDFASLVSNSADIQSAVIVVDIREGQTLDRLPEILKEVKKLLRTRVVFLDAQDAVLVRRYSETRRPHPLGRQGDGLALHCRRAATAGPDPQRRRHPDRHLELQRA